MEEQKVVSNNGGKRTQTSINGGGVGGLLVLGGALAVTGLIALASFATKKNKAKDGGGLQKPESESQEELDHCGSKNEDEAAQGRGSLLQNSTANDATECCTVYETSKMLRSSQLLIVEEKLDVKANVEEGIPSCFAQEIMISDDSPPGSATSSNENGIGTEECLSDNPCLGKEELDKSETEDETEEEITESENEDASSKTEEETEDEMNEEEDEDEEDIESDDDENRVENGSEETVRSSLDSNEEPIWPAELIEQKQTPSKQALVNFQSPPKGLDESAEEIAHTKNSAKANDDKIVTRETMLMEKTGLFVVQENKLSIFNPLKLTMWIFPMLLLTFLFVLALLTHRSPESPVVLGPGSLQ